MLQIILCDDDPFTLRLLTGLLERAIRKSGTAAKIVCLASTGIEVLQFIRGGGTYLYFLDYDLGKDTLNGIDLVRQIYRADPEGKIVFVTSHGDKGMEILRSGVRPYGFMEKLVEQDEMVRLSLSEILYVDSVKTVAHSVCFHTFDGSEITVRDTIEHVGKLLGDSFIRCHRSVLVNEKHILSLRGGMIKLSNSALVPCALGRKRAVSDRMAAGKKA